MEAFFRVPAVCPRELRGVLARSIEDARVGRSESVTEGPGGNGVNIVTDNFGENASDELSRRAENEGHMPREAMKIDL
ncbi:hypothetical protein JIG36_31120 [Actinoplanes sp. LDG1-06]|uniref:Uncharacterized protein n=1 Tax=Paractinoplanes ovalisporus TaxID=2810368 RepID=A0ABS2AJF1_9ACTN|nr:hypothetical protein [Actinoplanes ovalisporus]MBM2619974.1 hypothetical protein [Actinoplanes ovalisporus]